MSKMPNALITNAGRLGGQDDSVIGNLAAGTQYGFSPHLALLDAATPLVMRPMTYVVTNVPGMFKYVPHFAEFCKVFFEQICHSVEGVTVQYQNEGHAAPNQSDGQHATMVGDTKRSDINPTFNCIDYNGMPCWKFIKEWICMNKDPDTQAAPLNGIIDPSTYILPHTYSVFSADMVGIQYDMTLRTKNIIDALQMTAVHPQDTGDAGFQHEISSSHLPERQFQFHAVLQHNANTCAAGRMIAETLQLHKPNPNFATPVSEQVSSLIQGLGLEKEVATDAANYTPLGADAAVLSQ